MGIRHYQCGGAQALDIFFAFQNECSRPAISLDTPSAGCGKTIHPIESQNLWHKFTHLQCAFNHLSVFDADTCEIVYPDQLFAFSTQNRDAVIWLSDRKCTDYNSLCMLCVVCQAHNEFTQWVQTSRESVTHTMSSLRDPSPNFARSASAFFAWASYKRQYAPCLDINAS